MENQDPPIRHICCGRVFRNEAVSYKSFCLFNQVEGLVINESSSFAEMKGTLEYFVEEMFGKGTKMRFRPSYFPFTEPSAEIDISCFICQGKFRMWYGKSKCSYKCWI